MAGATAGAPVEGNGILRVQLQGILVGEWLWLTAEAPESP